MNDPVNTSHEISDLAETWGGSYEISDATGFNSGYWFLEQHYMLVLMYIDARLNPLSRSMKYIASASWDETIRIWDPQTGVSQTLTRHTAGLSCLAFSSDSKCLVSGSWDGSVIVWDVTSGGIISGPSQRHSDLVHCVTFSPDDRQVVSASKDGTVRAWEV